MTIGACKAIDLDGPNGARARARELLADFYNGIDPKADRQKARRGVTLRATLDEYLKTRKELRPATAKDYRGSIERHLGDWLDKPLREITPEMVEARHASIQAVVERERRGRAAS